MAPLGRYSLHVQVEAYSVPPVIKDFTDAPLWQVLGSSEHRRSLESLVPHDAALVVSDALRR